MICLDAHCIAPWSSSPGSLAQMAKGVRTLWGSIPAVLGVSGQTRGVSENAGALIMAQSPLPHPENAEMPDSQIPETGLTNPVAICAPSPSQEDTACKVPIPGLLPSHRETLSKSFPLS